MFILEENMNSNNITDLTAYAYEAIMECNEAMHEAREEMMVTEHQAIISESTYLYNEGVKEFFNKIKTTIVNLIKRFMAWIDNAITTLLYHTKAGGKLRDNVESISKGANIVKSSTLEKLGLEKTKMRVLRTAKEMESMARSRIIKWNDIVKTYTGVIGSFDVSDEEFETAYSSNGKESEQREANAIGLQNASNTDKVPVTIKYLLNDLQGVIDYCNGSSKLNNSFIMEVKKLKGELKKALAVVQKSSRNEERIYKKGSGDEATTAAALQKRYNIFAKYLSRGLKDTNAILSFVKEKNIQLSAIANIFLRAYRKGNSGNDSIQNNSAMIFNW